MQRIKVLNGQPAHGRRYTVCVALALVAAGCSSDGDAAASPGDVAEGDAEDVPMSATDPSSQDSSSGDPATDDGTEMMGTSIPEPTELECAPVCGDFVLECGETDNDCPTTQSAGLDIPSWDCTGTAPSNIYAYAAFADGGDRLQDGACLMFFEGAEGLFYAQWSGLGPADGLEGCEQWQGCVCPTDPSYDRRLYAFTSSTEGCDGPALVDHGNNTGMGTNLEQAVSNDCRKYLFALHGDGDPTGAPEDLLGDIQREFDLPYTYVAGSLDEMFTRITQFPKAEVTCLQTDTPFGGVLLQAANLLMEDIQLNPGYAPK